ncbi:hypothetical protein D3C86_1748470 [compost metagenome]
MLGDLNQILGACAGSLRCAIARDAEGLERRNVLAQRADRVVSRGVGGFPFQREFLGPQRREALPVRLGRQLVAAADVVFQDHVTANILLVLASSH